MPIAQVNGLALAYDDTGGSGPVLVFSHGFLMDRTMYAPQIEALRARYRCISWDQRGFGETGPVAAAFSYWDSAKDALGLIDALGIAQATFIGLSQGGFLSMRAALLAPQKVKALVLFSTRAGLDTDETEQNFLGLKAEWTAHGAANVAGFLGNVLVGGAPADQAPWQAKWAAMSKDALAHPIDTLVGRDDLTPRLAEIAQPAIVFHGDADSAIDIGFGEALAKGLPGCKGFVRIPGAGHAPNLTHAGLVAAPLTDFLAQWA